MLRSQHSRTLDEFEKVTAMEPSASYDDSRHQDDAPFVVASSVAECSDGGQNSSAHEPCAGRRDREDSVPHETDDDNAQKPNPEVCAMLISTDTLVAISASDDAGVVRHGVRDDTKAAEPTSQIESSTPGGLSEPSLLETISETIDDGGGGNKVESPRKPPAASKQQQRGKQPPIGTKLDQRTALELLEENCMESHNQENSTPRNAGVAQESDSGDVHNPNPEVCTGTSAVADISVNDNVDVIAHHGACDVMKLTEPTSPTELPTPDEKGSEATLFEMKAETLDSGVFTTSVRRGKCSKKVESPRKPAAGSKQEQEGKQPPNTTGSKLDQGTALERLREMVYESSSPTKRDGRKSGGQQLSSDRVLKDKIASKTQAKKIAAVLNELELEQRLGHCTRPTHHLIECARALLDRFNQAPGCSGGAAKGAPALLSGTTSTSVGLSNGIGENNCFVNCIMQALFRITPFRRALKSEHAKLTKRRATLADLEPTPLIDALVQVVTVSLRGSAASCSHGVASSSGFPLPRTSRL